AAFEFRPEELGGHVGARVNCAKCWVSGGLPRLIPPRILRSEIARGSDRQEQERRRHVIRDAWRSAVTEAVVDSVMRRHCELEKGVDQRKLTANELTRPGPPPGRPSAPPTATRPFRYSSSGRESMSVCPLTSK